MKERWTKIVSLVNGSKELSVIELSNSCGVSEVTIRKDLIELEKQGLLIRTHGGAVALTERNVPSYFARSQFETPEKQAIAKAAAELIEEGDSVIIDAGTTPLAVASYLKDKKISVVTNSLTVGMELSDSAGTISLTSGEIINGRLSLAGPDAEKYIESLRVNKAIIGASGFRADYGFTTSSTIEAAIKQKMVKAANQVIIVVDHTKFDKVKLANFIAFTNIYMVVTSTKAPKEALQALTDNGVKVKLADVTS
ncbi:DeoR/GlpR family DNA-binding transcription regulator [Paenibacillus hamazuiensis]|uniref:DeoR/GlpR family DNA-binding transcription regulator n=1 Tax=Paenibacillus hamazuiensis TaxID=2936508 RepID=UPI00200F24A5|nr:DeoR/GlpR family DNA-binding transcription regulator [Paenibacillus hamazuiensis]